MVKEISNCKICMGNETLFFLIWLFVAQGEEKQ